MQFRTEKFEKLQTKGTIFPSEAKLERVRERERDREWKSKLEKVRVFLCECVREIESGRKDEFILRFCVDQDIEKQLAEERERERGERER